MIYSWIFVT